MKRVVLCGYYGMGNGGDEALLATLLQLLPADWQPIVLSGDPATTADRYGVVAIPRKSPIALWRALRSSQAFIWGGGSLMQDTTSLASPVYYAALMILAQVLGLRTIAWAQGLGPLRRPISRWLTRWVLARCQGVSVRDRASAALLRSWGWSQVTIAPDPVWALAGVTVPAWQDLPRPRLAVILRPCAWLTPDRLAAIATALRQVQAETGAYILLIPFQPARDRPIAETLAASIPADRRQIVELADPAQLKGLLATVDLAIAMRLHGAIMAAAEGVPCFALAYDPKVLALMDDLGLAGWDLVHDQPRADRRPADDATAIAQIWLQAWRDRHPDQHQTQHQTQQPANPDPTRSAQTLSAQTLANQVQIHQTLLANVLA